MSRLRYVTDNFWWKLLALGIAVALWAIVANEPELSTFITVRSAYKNLPDDLEISAIEPAGPISLELRGPSGELRNLGEVGIRPAVTLDMSGVPPGEHTCTIGNGNVNLPRGVRLVRAIPSAVRFTFEQRETRSVPVEVRFSGEGAQGYMVAHSEVTPRELEIVGPASRVAAVRAAITDTVNVSNGQGSAEFHVNAFIDDPYVRFSSPPRVTVSVTMAKK